MIKLLRVLWRLPNDPQTGLFRNGQRIVLATIAFFVDMMINIGQWLLKGWRSDGAREIRTAIWDLRAPNGTRAVVLLFAAIGVMLLLAYMWRHAHPGRGRSTAQFIEPLGPAEFTNYLHTARARITDQSWAASLVVMNCQTTSTCETRIPCFMAQNCARHAMDPLRTDT